MLDSSFKNKFYTLIKMPSPVIITLINLLLFFSLSDGSLSHFSLELIKLVLTGRHKLCKRIFVVIMFSAVLYSFAEPLNRIINSLINSLIYCTFLLMQ